MAGTDMKNQAEIDTWNGAIGERWASYQEELDARIRIYGEQVLATATLREGMRVLDVGAGCGDMTLEAARAVGDAGKVVGLDISRPMLARARERANGLSNVELVEHDAATFVTDAPFDAIISRFGVMFFDEPAGAFANIRGAIKPGGGLTFVCWQSLADNPWAALPLSAVLERPSRAARRRRRTRPGRSRSPIPGRVRDMLDAAPDGQTSCSRRSRMP